jgi:hypothetical protein
MNDQATPAKVRLTDGLGPADPERAKWYERGQSWALADALSSTKPEWVADDIANAYADGAMSALRAERSRPAMPEPVERLLSYAGKTMRTARSPNLTAREAIEVGNWLAAVRSRAQRCR